MESGSITGKLLSKSGEVDAEEFYKAPITLLYFSAHWCGPCQKFTPVIADNYAKWNKDSKRVEIIFVTFDKKEDQFNDYYGKMPWLALPYQDARIKTLAEKYEPEGIPFLCVINKKGDLLSDNGYETVMMKKEKAADEWAKLYK
jgi:nucleoredoxin